MQIKATIPGSSGEIATPPVKVALYCETGSGLVGEVPLPGEEGGCAMAGGHDISASALLMLLLLFRRRP